MSAFIREWSDCFKTKSANHVELAQRYVGGLLSQTARKNMERMDERLGHNRKLGTDTYQATQQFISDSPWDVAPIYARIAEVANQRATSEDRGTLIVDESSFAKKGDSSVGVARQWNGRLGKTDNCQTGVFSAICHGTSVSLCGCRLYLPPSWTDDPERCRDVGVPEERLQQGPLTKIDLARELIEEALGNGLRFECITMDAFYGRDGSLRRFIEERHLVYCVDVPVNTRVFTMQPTAERRPEKIGAETVSVADLAAGMLSDKRIRGARVQLRDGDNGPVEADVKAVRVWEWTAEAPKPVEVWMIARRMSDGTLKVSLSNAPKDEPIERLARWQGARFWVERCFQDAKSHCGMAQYQSRGWLAWHHHMALVTLAVLFSTQERRSGELSRTGLTMADVQELMEWALVRKPTEQEILRRVEERHRKRKAVATQKKASAARAVRHPPDIGFA